MFSKTRGPRAFALLKDRGWVRGIEIRSDAASLHDLVGLASCQRQLCVRRLSNVIKSIVWKRKRQSIKFTAAKDFLIEFGQRQSFDGLYESVIVL